MNSYENARIFALDSLSNALEAHVVNDVYSIENGLEKYEGLVSKADPPTNSLLYLTLEFWSGWSDSAIHSWNFYEPFTKDDWPRLAALIIENLKKNREITNTEILKNFSVNIENKKISIFSKLWFLINGKQF